jgi:RNA polymerase sigma-70 factor (ECF subfamily)
LEPGSDEALFEQYRRGNREALRALIERHQADLMRFLIRLTGDVASAEDVFQETFLQVHLSSDTFDSSRRFRPWLFTIAANKARDLLRRKGRRRTLELSAPVEGGATAGTDEPVGSFVDLLEIDIPGPDARLNAEETSQLVQTVLNQLAPPLREILLLAYFQRLSYAKMHEELGIPLGTVKSRLHAAVAAFARKWQALTNDRTRRPKSP